ncbi:MAG: SlyX family protein [Pseudomonadales bacterium]
MADNLEDRLVDLESRQAFLDDTITSLNRSVADQQQRIAHLERRLALLIEQVRESELDLDLPPADESPPHY